jgi:hypothetical protein
MCVMQIWTSSILPCDDDAVHVEGCEGKVVELY